MERCPAAPSLRDLNRLDTQVRLVKDLEHLRRGLSQPRIKLGCSFLSDKKVCETLWLLVGLRRCPTRAREVRVL